MHAGHNTYVVIVDLIDLLQVQQLGHVPVLVREDKLSDSLRDEGRRQDRLLWLLGHIVHVIPTLK